MGKWNSKTDRIQSMSISVATSPSHRIRTRDSEYLHMPYDSLLWHCLRVKLQNSPDAIVIVDAESGAATTAHALLQQVRNTSNSVM